METSENQPRRRPFGICTACQSFTYAQDMINSRCDHNLYGLQCEGEYRDTVSAGNWAQCLMCSATGHCGDAICLKCSGIGWWYVQDFSAASF
jgi:hypothetical protein